MLAADGTVWLEDAESGLLRGRDSGFEDPLDGVKKRRRFGTDQPETWDAMPSAADYAEVTLLSAEAKKLGFDCSPRHADECVRALAGPFRWLRIARAGLTPKPSPLPSITARPRHW